MSKTYVPKLVRDVHELAIYMARYNRVVRPALSVLDTDAVTAYDALYAAVLAIDALAEVLTPIAP